MAYAVPTLDVQRSRDFSDDLLHNLLEMKAERCLTDFSIQVEEVFIPCHSAVMAAASPYFRAMLNTEMKEKDQRIVRLDSFNLLHLQKIVDYCYNGCIVIELDNAQEYLDIVEYFQLQPLKKRLEDFLCEHLITYNCIGWYQQASKFHLSKLGREAKELMISKFSEVVQTDEFLQLNLASLMDYLRQDIPNSDEELVHSACMNWVKFDDKSRNIHVLELISLVQLTKCRSSFLKNVLKTLDKSWSSYFALKDIITEIIVDRVEDITISPKGSIKTKTELIVAAGMSAKNALNRKYWKLNLDSGECTLLGNIPHHAGKYYSAKCKIPGGLFVCGGSPALGPFTPTKLMLQTESCHAGLEFIAGSTDAC